jgi:hypothetical protein
VADAYARSSEWKRLREFLDDGNWADSEYLRRAFLSRALEKLDEPTLATQEWKDAVSAARSRPDSAQRLERLARIAVQWGWEQRAEELMWSMARSPSCPRWVLDTLWTSAGKRADTAQLHKISGLLALADPQSVVFRNNRAFFSLLLRSEDGNPQREAEKLFQENLGNSTVAVTWAFALYQRGKVAEALAVTASLPREELLKPENALFHAIFLLAAGESAKAGEFLPVAQKVTIFPEEKALLDRARLTVAKAADEKAVAEAALAAKAARAARTAEADAAVVEPAAGALRSRMRVLPGRSRCAGLNLELRTRNLELRIPAAFHPAERLRHCLHGAGSPSPGAERCTLFPAQKNKPAAARGRGRLEGDLGEGEND